MDHALYRQYQLQYLREAYQQSDKTSAGVHRALSEIAPPGRFARHKEEKLRALSDLRASFEEHRHWPLDIALSHLGINLDELTNE